MIRDFGVRLFVVLTSALGHFGRFWHIRRMSGLGVISEMPVGFAG